ncbi:MAG: hypothetical protein HRU24_06120 [Gammaproteobacteria bacterium]|nr:hypothetical protein [Gammaproteobacteria bacterium]
MMNDFLEQKLLMIETIALSTPGVVGISIGLSKTNQRVIKLYLERPVLEISLPPELISQQIEYEYIGAINIE